jgi:hypothetical protein
VIRVVGFYSRIGSGNVLYTRYESFSTQPSPALDCVRGCREPWRLAHEPSHMLQANNLVLAVTVVIAAYIWRRAHFRTPRFLRLSVRTPRLVLAAVGWTLVVGAIAYSIGGILAGRTQISKSGVEYASRERDAASFWREIVLQTIVIGGTGVVLVALARRRRS